MTPAARTSEQQYVRAVLLSDNKRAAALALVSSVSGMTAAASAVAPPLCTHLIVNGHVQTAACITCQSANCSNYARICS